MSESSVQFTNAGLAELISAKNKGFKAAITEIGAGDKSYKPSASQTALVNEKQREPIAEYEELSSTSLRMGTIFNGEDEYEVREIGFYLDSGTLLAVYSVPNTLLTYKSARSSWIQKFTLDISLLPTDSVTVVIGTENINLMMTEELAIMATTQIDNMTRHLGLKDVVTSLQNTIELQQVHIGTLEQAGQTLQRTQSAMIRQRQEQDGEIQTSLAKMATAQVSTMYRQVKHITSANNK